MTYEVFAKDWGEVYDWMSDNLPRASWSHTWCDYEHPETRVWTEIILFNLFDVDDDDLLLFKLCNSHLLRGTTKEASMPADNSEYSKTI